MSPTVSIILPTFNGAKWVEKAILSVLTQSFLDYELIIINDGSTDNTEEIVNNFVKKDSRIKYIKNEQNLGIQKTLNRGLKEAKGEYIARIDDDDIWCNVKKLEKQIGFLEKNKDYALVGTGAIIVNKEGKEISRFLMPNKDNDIRNRILGKNCFIHSSVVFKKDIAIGLGGYSEEANVKHIEDHDLWLKLGLVSKFINIKEYFVIFTTRAESITSQNRIIQAKHLIFEIKNFKSKYPKFIQAYILNIIKLLFFHIQKIIPINNRIIYKLQAFYKKF